MKALAYIGIAYLILGIESVILFLLDLPFHAPDLSAVIAVFLGTTMSLRMGVVTAFSIGLLQDGFTGAPVGLFTETLVILFLLARGVASKMTVAGPVAVMLVGFCASLLSQVLFLVLTGIFDQSFSGYQQGVRAMVPNALITAPFAPLVFIIYAKVDNLMSRRRRENMFFR